MFSYGIKLFEGENNIINNAATGSLKITSKNPGIYDGEGDGDDNIINNGYLFVKSESAESIDLGGGDDYFANTGTLDLSGHIAGGEGEDTFAWGGAKEPIL